MTKILHLTDLHLFADPDAKLQGVTTRPLWQRMINYFLPIAREFDLVVMTGDLAHDEQRETYEALAETIPTPWVQRLRLLPGNHDHRRFMREIFPQATSPQDGSPDAPLRIDDTFADCHVLGLDSHVFGQVPGYVDPGEYEWLAERLASGTSPVILFLHHPPVPVGTGWMDEIGLQNPERLLELITSSSRVRLVHTGHVHHHFDSEIESVAEEPIRFGTTPATSIQFTPHTEKLVLDDKPAGYRVISITADGIESTVHRLPDSK